MTIREWLTTNFGADAPKQIVNEHVGGMVRGLETYLKTFDGGRQ